MQKDIAILLASLLLVLLGSCKSAEPGIEADIEYSSKETRPDWKEKIDHGKIGYFDMANGNMINLDSPPHLKGQDPGRVPDTAMDRECENFISGKDNRLSRIEFLVDEEGYTSRFYVLESAGPCDDLLAKMYVDEMLVPGKKSGNPMPTLVHVEYRFTEQ